MSAEPLFSLTVGCPPVFNLLEFDSAGWLITLYWASLSNGVLSLSFGLIVFVDFLFYCL